METITTSREVSSADMSASHTDSSQSLPKQPWETPKLQSISVEDDTEVPKVSFTTEDGFNAPPPS